MGPSFCTQLSTKSLDFLLKHGEKAIRSPSLGVKWNIGGGFSARETTIHFPVPMLALSKQIAFEGERISKFNPKVVVSDSRLSTIFAAKAHLYPAVTILNQFKILLPPRFRQNWLSRFYERIEGDVLGLFWSLSNEVLFPDLPPPYTIGEANIADTDVSGKVKFIGFMSPKIISIEEKALQTVKRQP